ncbi:MAG: phage integrase SAM-like domain-containing protein [Pirellula sp.]|jgi:site-specific recombinase XerD|nr:phage integrase SAM-like domain-containing protein [Pirellula sp.]
MPEHSPRVGEYCRRNLENSKSCLLEYFTAEESLKGISSDDAQAYRLWLADSKGFAQATIAQHVKKTKQFFLAALKVGVVDKSPFSEVLMVERSIELNIETPTNAGERYAWGQSPRKTLRLSLAKSMT